MRREDTAAREAEVVGPAKAGSDAPHSIPLARVVRAPNPEFGERPPAPAGAMAVEVGGMRLVVPAGFDRRTLAMVLDEIEARKSKMGVY